MSTLQCENQKSDLYTRDYFLQDDVCRLCWNRNADKSIIENSSENCVQEIISIVDKIRYSLDLDFSLESYPKKVCFSCFHKIESFYDFKQFCHKTDRKLREILKEDHTTMSKLSLEVELPSYAVKEEKFGLPLELSKSDPFFNFLDSELSIGETKAPFLDRDTKYDDFSSTELVKNDSLDGFFDTLHVQSHENVTTNQLDNRKAKVKKKCKQKRSSNYCNICHMDLGNTENFTLHNSEAHGVELDGQFKCFGCEKLFKSRKTRLGHEIKFCKGLKDGYKCLQCERYLPNRKTYESHMRDHRDNTNVDLPDDLFKCVKCSKSFTTKDCLKNHMLAHDKEKKNFVCESCGRVFTRQDYLHKHRLTHSGERQHTCPHCGFRTAQRSSLIVHIRKHTGERPYSCDVCSQRCVSSSNLRAHRRRHLGLKNYECSICQKKFGYKISLEEHVASTHERSQSFPCEYCGAIYTRLRGLRRHLLAKHGKDKAKTPLPTESEKSTEVIRLVPTTSMEKLELPTEKNMQEKPVLPTFHKSLCIEKSVLASDKDVIENQYYLKIVCVEASK